MTPTDRVRPTTTTDWFQIGGKPFESLMEVHKQMLDTFEQVQRDRLARTMEEGKLASEFAAKATGARSLPELMAIYHEWMSKCAEMFAEDSRKFMTDSQKVANAAVRLLSNGRGDLSN